MIFGTWNPEKNLTRKTYRLSTSPVRCSHCTLGNPKSYFQQYYSVYSYILLIIYIISQAHTHTRLTTLFSETTRVSWYQKGKTNLDFTEARDSEWQWHQLGHMQVCISLQTDNHAITPPLSFFYRPDALPAAQPTASKHWRHKKTVCNPLAHPTWQYHHTNSWIAKLFHLTEGLLCSFKRWRLWREKVVGCHRGLWKEPVVMWSNWNIKQAMSQQVFRVTTLYVNTYVSSPFRHWPVA